MLLLYCYTILLYIVILLCASWERGMRGGTQTQQSGDQMGWLTKEGETTAHCILMQMYNVGMIWWMTAFLDESMSGMGHYAFTTITLFQNLKWFSPRMGVYQYCQSSVHTLECTSPHDNHYRSSLSRVNVLYESKTWERTWRATQIWVSISNLYSQARVHHIKFPIDHELLCTILPPGGSTRL